MTAAPASAAPVVSVLLPTYNRAPFLPAALDAIAGQTFTDWELVVVDDGSVDDTKAIIEAFAVRVVQPVTYVRQDNAGAYAARNTALARARAPYVAFYDSDDLWLRHHLATSVTALAENADVDWVYSACRIVDFNRGVLTDPDTFRIKGVPRPFLGLRVDDRGVLRVFNDPRTVAWALLYGLYCGLQNSVIRTSLFGGRGFQTVYRNEAEDQLQVIRALKRGHRIGYINDVHVQYHVHGTNSSAAAAEQDVDRQLAVYRPLVRGFTELRQEFTWEPRERRAIARRLMHDHFWHIGYNLLWRAGRHKEALVSYRVGLEAWPWSPSAWKTFLIARLRLAADRYLASR